MGEFYLTLYIPHHAVIGRIKYGQVFSSEGCWHLSSVAAALDVILHTIGRSIVLNNPLIWCWIDVVSRDPAVGEVDGEVFDVSADNLLNDNENSVVELQNHELNEQLMLISQLDEDEKNALVKIINSMLTKKRMKDLLDGKVNF